MSAAHSEGNAAARCRRSPPRRGTCRDFATLMMEAARALGFRRPLCLRLSLCAGSRRRQSAISAAARRMPGARSICPAPAGSNSIRPMALSAVGTSFASRWRGRRIRPFPFMDPISATPRTTEGMDVSVNVRRLPERTLLAPHDGNLSQRSGISGEAHRGWTRTKRRQQLKREEL